MICRQKPWKYKMEKIKRLSRRYRKNKINIQSTFVFNNVQLIKQQQCKDFMEFDDKTDELIPYSHTIRLYKL